MSNADLVPLVQALAGARVLCVGDVMLDHYIHGRVERISPEAPVPILNIDGEEQRLGGAGNVLRNLHALGAETCFISVTGSDAAARDVSRLVAELGTAEAHLLAERGRTTTVKTRYIAETQQLLRIDRERVMPLPAKLRADLLDQVRASLKEYRVVILSDYAKGVLMNGVAGDIIAAAREAGATVIVDPKSNVYADYRGATIVKPNRRELAAASGRALDGEGAIVAAARALMGASNIGAMLVTCGKDGMLLIDGERSVAQPRRRGTRGL